MFTLVTLCNLFLVESLVVGLETRGESTEDGGTT